MVSLLWVLSCAPNIIVDIPPPPPLRESSNQRNNTQRYLVLRAWHHSHNHKWEAARLSFGEAAKHAPNDPWLYVHWGDAAMKLGKKDEAVDAWSKALSLFGVRQTEERALVHQKLRSYP